MRVREQNAMTPLQQRLNDWLDGRLDADDMNAVGFLCSALIAVSDDTKLLKAENQLWRDGISIDEGLPDPPEEEEE